MRLFDVTADYRASNPDKPHYYVVASNRKDCKRIFSSFISWLKIYDIVEITEESTVAHIIENPSKYVILGQLYD